MARRPEVSPSCLREPRQPRSPSDGPVCVCPSAGGAVQTSRRGEAGGRPWWADVVAGVSAPSALQVPSPSLGHGGHSPVLMGLGNHIFHPLLVGYSQPWAGMGYHHGGRDLVCVPQRQDASSKLAGCLVCWGDHADLPVGRGWAGGAHACCSRPGSRASARGPGVAGSGPWQDVVFRSLREREVTMSSPV